MVPASNAKKVVQCRCFFTELKYARQLFVHELCKITFEFVIWAQEAKVDLHYEIHIILLRKLILQEHSAFLILEGHSHLFVNHFETLTSQISVQLEEFSFQRHKPSLFNRAILVNKFITYISPLPEILEA